MSDLEMPDVYSEDTVKARMAHCCCECEGGIPAGESYQLSKGLWDGRWETYKTCADCAALRKDIQDQDGIGFCELCDHVFEANRLADIKRFMDIRRKRNAPGSPKGWMELREAELLREGGES